MNNGDSPASPLKYDNSGEYVEGIFYGLTKREHFAAMAMQGILSNRRYDPPRRNKINNMAIDAVDSADALLTALEKDNEQA